MNGVPTWKISLGRYDRMLIEWACDNDDDFRGQKWLTEIVRCAATHCDCDASQIEVLRLAAMQAECHQRSMSGYAKYMLRTLDERQREPPDGVRSDAPVVRQRSMFD